MLKNMRIKRLDLRMEYEVHSMHVFHTENVIYNNDPPTVVNIDGREFEASVSLEMEGDKLKLTIEPT